MNSNKLKLKKVVLYNYTSSLIVYAQVSLLNDIEKTKVIETHHSYKIKEPIIYTL